MSEAARWRRSSNANTLREPVSRFQVLHEIFELQADERPKSVAIIFGQEEITYAELEQRANRLARHLRARGVRRGSLIAILLPRSTDTYVAILGILKVGAAYVPIDPDYPMDRITYILENSGARTLITTANLEQFHLTFNGIIIRMDADREAIDVENSTRLKRDMIGVGPRDLCYVIYTSGSTGRPKGVQIEHRNICNLVNAEGKIFKVHAKDRVYQGSSLSFDLSLEEIWLAFHAGATLIAATPEMVHAGPDLARFLKEYNLTVLSCVPTLLSMLSEDVPSLRLIIFGGEACPPELVSRWIRPGRRIVNTYGPTEATVIATYAELARGKPVTIGRAVEGYRVHVLDDRLRTIPNGTIGEICIGGIGVARGYIGLPEETRSRFLPDPFASVDEVDARIYRSGDLGRFDEQGNLEFLGRGDAQVKLRGFRIELAEIESVFIQHPSVRAAVCTVREDVPGIQQLVGYVVPSNGKIDEESLRSYLRDRLPTYMVPVLIETITNLPKLPSGKIDRSSLPAPSERKGSTSISAKLPTTNTEHRIAEVWKTLFRPHPVSVDDDFFLDLGGHSLLAARMVSELRKDPQFAGISMLDVYEHPTIASLATVCDTVSPGSHQSRTVESPSVNQEKYAPNKNAQHFRAGILQAGGLYFVFGFRALQWVTPYLVYFLLCLNDRSVLESAAWAAATSMIVFPTLLLVVIGLKWLVLGHIQPGRYPLWGSYYIRFWLVRNLISALPLDRLCGTPLLPLVYRLLGAHIGQNVHLETDQLVAFDLISIGDGTSVDDTASLLGSTVEEGELLIGPIQIGNGCFIGTRSILREYTLMEDGARLEDLSLLPLGARIPQDETWIGSPARFAANTNRITEPPPARTPRHRAAIATLYALLLLIIPVLPLIAFVPGVAILTQIDAIDHPFLYLAAAPLVGASFVLLLTIGIVLFKWLLVGRVHPGKYLVHSWFYVKKWIVDQLLAISLDVVGSLHATVYLSPWYRALGARLGRFVELSTATSTTPDLMEIGDGGTVADEASLGAARVEGGWLTLAPTRLGRRAFIGNGAVIPPGTTLGDESLVGVLSICPVGNQQAMRTRASWLGSPPILLPRRQQSTPFPEQTTYAPTWKLRLARGAFEILRVTLPPAGFILVTTTVVTAVLEFYEQFGLGIAFAMAPIIYGACCIALALTVVIAKWIIMRRFRPFEHPQWSWFVWKLEFVNALYEFMVTPLALDALQGTPFLPWYFRLLGARIGRRTYFHTTGLIEFDLVEVGDEAVMNEDSVLQAHLFEDRILKASWLRIGHGCEVGAGSVVLYDTNMEDGARLDALSLLMKGETLPGGTAWVGIPAQRVNR
jgi:non-ribosomal peptide synthetase-like protein